MKLVDILARELVEWPEGAVCITQDRDGEVWPCNNDSDLSREGGYWKSTDGFMIGEDILPGVEVAEDNATSVVTRGEWQAAVEALKAEQVKFNYENVDVNANYVSHTEHPENAECKIITPKETERVSIPELGEYWPEQGGHNGGLVAAHGNVAAHYLIIAAKDVGSHEWGERGNESQATSKRDGFANTATLMEGNHPAAKAATGYTDDGHDDFYLPAAAELYQCWLNVSELFAKDTWYWSSTQRSAYYAFYMDFDDGCQDYGGKYNGLRVRPVRRLFIDSLINSGGDEVKDLNVKAEPAAELKWPDGAEFVGTTGRNMPNIFYRNIRGGFYEHAYETGNWKVQKGNPVHLPIIPRPDERAVEWDGVGNPPAGIDCEFQHHNAPNGIWYPTTIRFSSHAHVIYVDSIQGCEECFAVNDPCKIDFRPIRTQEQIAADERSRACDHIYGVITGDGVERKGNASDMAEALYDAGYRKQVAK